MVTFVKATYVLVTFVHISNISAFYWSNFDQTFWTQFFLDHDFCRPKCSWAKLLRTHIFLMQIFFSSPKMLGLTVFIPEILLDPKKKSNSIFFTPNFFRPKIFPDPKYFWTQNFFKFFFSDEIFFTYNIFQKIFQSQDFCFPQFFFRKICLNTKFFFQTQNFLPLKIFRPQILQNFDQKSG